MIAALLFMFVGGIGLAMAVEDPRQVTLRWLRLGGIIAVSLLAVAAAVGRVGQAGGVAMLLYSAVLAPFVVQLVTVQLGWRRAQRVAALLGFVAAVVMAAPAVLSMLPTATVEVSRPARIDVWISVAISSGVLGG